MFTEPLLEGRAGNLTPHRLMLTEKRSVQGLAGTQYETQRLE